MAEPISRSKNARTAPLLSERARKREPVGELSVAGVNDAEHIGDEGGVVALSLPPALGARGKGFVVGLFCALDLLLDRDVLSHVVARSIHEQQREQPAHASVSVVEQVRDATMTLVDEVQNIAIAGDFALVTVFLALPFRA